MKDEQWRDRIISVVNFEDKDQAPHLGPAPTCKACKKHLKPGEAFTVTTYADQGYRIEHRAC